MIAATVALILLAIGWVDFAAQFLSINISGLFILKLILLKLPYLLSQLMPFIIIITNFIYLAYLWKSNQLVIIMNGGLDWNKITMYFIFISSVLSILNLLCFNPIGITLMNIQENLEHNKTIENYKSNEHRNLIAIEKHKNIIYDLNLFDENDYKLYNITIVQFKNKNSEYKIIEAKSGYVKENIFFLKDVIIFSKNTMQKLSEYSFPTELSNKNLINLTKISTNSSIFTLLKTIKTLKIFNIASGEYKNILYKLVVKSFAIILNVMLVFFLLRDGKDITLIQYCKLIILVTLSYLSIEIICNLFIYQLFKS